MEAQSRIHHPRKQHPERKQLPQRKLGSQQIFTIQEDHTSQQLCPICIQPIESPLAQSLKGVEDELRVHRNHEFNDAQRQYRREGYPEINWAIVPERAMKQLSTTKGDTKSLAHYSFHRGVCAGYYGVKGFSVIQSAIIHEVVASYPRSEYGGNDTFDIVRALVLLVTERLIAEDMGCITKRARKILEESCRVGEILYPDEDAQD